MDPHNPDVAQSEDPTSEAGSAPLGLSLHLADGHAVVQGHKLGVGPWQLEALSLAIPDVTFPFDVSGGAERFKNHRCRLQQLHVALPISQLNQLWSEVDWAAAGLCGVRDVHMRADAQGLQLGGLYETGERFAPFTCRLAVMPAGPAEIRVIFYGVRLFGLWPLPGALLPMALAQALACVPWEHCVPGAVSLKPGAALLREIMPRAGWRIPDVSDAMLTGLEVGPGRLAIMLQACDASSATSALGQAAYSLPHAAQAALSAMASFAEAEAALGRGDIDAAFRTYSHLSKPAPCDPWVAGRLLTLGLGHQDWHAATEALARDVLSCAPLAVEARLALANIALERQDPALAAAHFDTLAQAQDESITPLDRAAAELASASAIRSVDPERAMAALSRAMSSAPALGFGFAPLFALRRAAGDRAGALEAGTHWLAQAMSPQARVAALIDLGQVQMHEPQNAASARHHFDQAVSLDAQATGAWQGLADTAMAAGDGRAALAALEALAGVWCAQRAPRRAAETWVQAAQWAAEADLAQHDVEALWHQALQLWPHYSLAQIGLAEYVDALGDGQRACALYDALILQHRQDPSLGGAPVRRSRLATAMRRRVELDRLLATHKSACVLSDVQRTELLERALQLAPDDDETRACLVAQLRETQSFEALARLLAQSASRTQDLEQSRQACLEACGLFIERCHNPQAARPLLEALLGGDAHDDEAWAYLQPILEAQHDTQALHAWLEARAASAAPQDKAACMFALAQAQHDAPFATRFAAFEAVLDTEPSYQPAAEALVKLAHSEGDAAAQAQAYGLLASALACEDEQTGKAAQAAAHLAQAQAFAAQAQDDAGVLAQAQLACAEACQADPQALAAWTLRIELAVGQKDWTQAQSHAHAAQAHLRAIDAFALLMRLAELAYVTQDGFALARALSDARSKAQDLPHSSSVAQIVRSFLQRTNYPCHPPQLLSLLRDVGLLSELIDALDKSLTKSPSCDDGRFGELMRLLVDCERDVSRALVWCERMCHSFAQDDAPWHRHVSILLHHPDLGSPTPVFEAWAARREGRDRAIVLEAFSAYLQGQSNTDAALRILWDACRAQPRCSENVSRLAVLAKGLSQAQDFALLVDVLLMQADLAPQGAEQDSIWRSLADITSEQLDDLPKAVSYLERLTQPKPSDLLWSAGMLLDTGAYARLAEDETRLGILPSAQRLVLARGLVTTGDTTQLACVLDPLFVHPAHARDAWLLMTPPGDAVDAREALMALRATQLRRDDLAPCLYPWLSLTLTQERWMWQNVRPEMAELEPILAHVVWSETDTAWAAFVVSRATHAPGAWPARAARALCDCWPQNEPRLAAPLQVLLEEALSGANARLAVALSRQLLSLDSPACELWLTQALKVRVPHQEVCRLLEEHMACTKQQTQRLRLSQHIVRLKLEAGLWDEAAALLDAHPEEARDAVYADLAFALGEGQEDVQRQIQAARYAIDDALKLEHAEEAQRWSQTLAELYVSDGAQGEALSVLQTLWEQDASAHGAFAQWTHLVADVQDAERLRQGLATRLAQLEDGAARQIAVRLLTAAWATLPQARQEAMDALCDALGAAIDEASLMCVRRVFADAADPKGLLDWLVRFAQRDDLTPEAKQSAYQEAGCIAEDLGDAQAAHSHRLAAIQAGDTDAMHLDVCLRFARAHQQWPEHAAVYRALMHRLEDKEPQAAEPVAYKMAQYASDPDKHSVLEAHLSALEADTHATAHDVAVAHVDLALRSAACALAHEASEHWLTALQAPAPQAAWFRHAQAHCLVHDDAAARARLAQLAAAHLPMIEAQAQSAPEITQPWWRALAAHALAYTVDGAEHSMARYQGLVRAGMPWAVWDALVDDVCDVFLQAQSPSALIDLFATLLCQAPDARARARLHWRMGVVKRDAQADAEGAQAAFAEACAQDPEHWAAQTDWGLGYVALGQWQQGVEILEPCVSALGQHAPRRAMLGLLQAYEQSGAYAQALRTCGTLMARAVDDGVDGEAGLMLRQARSRCLVALARGQEAEMQWRDYLGSLNDDAGANLRAGALCALGTLALARGDKGLAKAHLEHATALEGACAQTRQALIDAWYAAEEYNRVVALRLREAEMTDVPEVRAQHLLAAAHILEDHLEDKAEANWLLEQACEATPRDPGLLHQLMDRYAQAGDTAKKLLCAERLMALFPSDYFGADFYFELAQGYADIDPLRAAAMAKRALGFDATHTGHQALCRTLYAAAGDWRAYVELEQALVPDLDDAAERGPRAAALAEVYLEQIGDTGRGLLALQMACEAKPDDMAYLRKRAAVLAQTPDGFAQATQCYRDVLRHEPTDTTTLRILARLAGAQGAMDKAYGYYACLLCLVPQDDEAERFVVACRKNRRAKKVGLDDARIAPALEKRVPGALVGLLEDVGAALHMVAVPAAQPMDHAIVKSVHCDIEESLSALMRMRGYTDEQAKAPDLIDKPGEARDLFLFAQSPDYFALRADLGVGIATGHRDATA